MNKENLINVMIKATKRAGNLIVSNFIDKSYTVKSKSSSADLVTTVDQRSQDVIISILNLEFPNINVIAEERNNVESSSAFYVDPLDGTLNFVHGIPFFAVSIGYWEEDKAIGGVVYDPLREELFYALHGKGAYLNGKKIKFQNEHELMDSLIATGWPYDHDKIPKTIKKIFKILPFCQEIRVLGSAALAMCYVAIGRLDGYWEDGLSPWDIAAGVVIAQEAGATVSSPTGNDLNLRSGDILSSSPQIHTQMNRILNDGI